MELEGRLENADYLAFHDSRAKPDQTQRDLILLYLLLAPIAAPVAYSYASPNPTPDWIVAMYILSFFVHAAFFVAWYAASFWLLRQKLKASIFYNLGDCSYRIEDEALLFCGSTFSASVPFRNMRSLDSFGDRAFILFSPHSGFLLPNPNAVTTGDFNAFVEELDRRIKSARGTEPDATSRS